MLSLSVDVIALLCVRWLIFNNELFVASSRWVNTYTIYTSRRTAIIEKEDAIGF